MYNNNNSSYSRTYSEYNPESYEESYNTYTADYAGTSNDNEYNYQSYQSRDESYYGENYVDWQDDYPPANLYQGNLNQPYQRESSSLRAHQTEKQNMPGRSRGAHDHQLDHNVSYGRGRNVDNKWNNVASPEKSRNRISERGGNTNVTSQNNPNRRSEQIYSGAEKGAQFIAETQIKQEIVESHTNQGTGDTHMKQRTGETHTKNRTGETHRKQGTGEAHTKQRTGETHTKQGTGETHTKEGTGETHTKEETANKSGEGTKDTSKNVTDIKEELKTELEESSEDDNPTPMHSKGLMGTLITLMGPEALNRKPDPLPPPQPMKLEDEREKYLGVKKSTEKVNYSDLYFDCGITEEMLEEAYLEEEDVPTNFRDLLPTDIGREVDKPEFYCKLCKVQTTSMGNFRDHLNGKSHKNNVEAFRLGKKLTGKKKKIAIDPSLVGQKSVSKEMVEGILEPIIGLSYITEYHSTSGILCVCNLCAVKFDRNIVVSHLTGIKHRLHYMKERKPDTYVHLKRFGGKKSQLSSFLDELSVDVEREDGRGLPTIKVYELSDSTETAPENNFSQQSNAAANEVTRVIKTQEAMLARRKPGNISFQDWVNEEFLKVKKNDKERSPSPSTQNQGIYTKQPVYYANYQQPVTNANNQQPMSNANNQGKPTTGMHSPARKRDFSEDGTPTAPLSNNPYGPPPIPFNPHALRPGQFPPDPYFRGPLNSRYMCHDEPRPPPLPDHSTDPYLYRREPYTDPYASKRFPYGDTYLDPDPLKRTRRVETYLDPDPLKRVLPKKDAPLPSAVVIDYGHRGTGNPEQRESHSRSILKKSHRKGDSETMVKEAVEQWEKDIQNILGKHSSVKAPDNLAMLSSTYSSPEASPSPVRGKDPPKRRELPFSKSYLESKKLKDFNETRKKAKAARDEISQMSPRRSSHSWSISPQRSRPSQPISPPRSRPSRPSSPPRSRPSRPISPPRARHSRSISPQRSRHSRSISPQRSRHSRPISPPRSRHSRPISPPRSRHSRPISPPRSRHSRSISPESLWHKKVESSFSMNQLSSEQHNLIINIKKEFSPNRSNSPLDKRPSRSTPDNNYGNRPSHTTYKSSYETDKYPSQSSKRRLSRSPDMPRKYHRPATPPEVKKEYERNRQIEAILAEPNEEDQVDRIANLLLDITSKLTKTGCDTHSAMEKLFSEPGLSKVLGSPKPQPKPQPESRKPPKQPTPREKVVFAVSSHKTPSRLNRPTLPGDFGESDDSS